MARVKLDPPRVLNRKVARLPEVRAGVREGAEKVAALARLFAGPHGSLPSRISVSSGSVDSFVTMTHDDAVAIEFGGTYKDGRHQKGLHILGNAVKAAGSL